MTTLATIFNTSSLKSKLEKNDLINNSFDKMFSDFYLDSFYNLSSSLKTNYGENQDEYFIQLQVPGFKKEDVKINFEGTELIISAELEKTEEKNQHNFFKKEFEKQSFKKVYSLPKNADKEKITAALKDGILEIKAPKKKEELIKKSAFEIKVQ
jgi:HSP20 family protein